MVKGILYTALCTALSLAASAQAINNNWSYRNIRHENYVRHFYENDYFSATDEFYTQGINMECVTPGFRQLPTRHVLLHPKNSTVIYGLALQHNAYTPASIQDPNLRLGDRPYAAAAMLQPFAIATNEARRQRITTMLSIGVTGQIAGGQWMQETIHRNTNNVMPEGWKYQVANDAVINYRIQYEKQLVRVNNILSISMTGVADAGTLLTSASAGINAMLGYFPDPYSSASRRRFALYIYTHAQAHAVGYNAMLQGGMFSNSIYTIPTADIERFVADNNYGLVIRYGGIYLEYSRTDMTREYKTGSPHAWGGVQIGVGF